MTSDVGGNEGPGGAAEGVRQGVRFVSTQFSVSSPVTASISAHKLPNDGALLGTTHPAEPTVRQRRLVRNLDAINQQLTERDHAVLQSLWTHRVLTTRQIQALHFGELQPASGLRLAQQTVAKLRQLWVIGATSRPKRRGDIGRPELVYYVDAVGDRLLRAEDHRKRRYQWREPSTHYLEHQLACADVHVQLVEAQRRGQVELVCCEVEPTSWRRYVGVGTTVTLKPDLFIETSSEPDSAYVDGFYVEVDLGTESIPTLIRKCREYQSYWRSGAEQDDDGNGFPLVVWHMTHKDPGAAERRRADLYDDIQKDRTFDADLFRIVAPDQLIELIQKGGDL